VVTTFPRINKYIRSLDFCLIIIFANLYKYFVFVLLDTNYYSILKRNSNHKEKIYIIKFIKIIIRHKILIDESANIYLSCVIHMLVDIYLLKHLSFKELLFL